MKAAALILLSLLPLSAQEPSPSEDLEPQILLAVPSRDLFDLATIYYNSARSDKDREKSDQSYRLAANKFDQFLRKFPQHQKALDAWYFLGLCYREIGEDDASRECFEAAATSWTDGKLVEAAALYLASDDYDTKRWEPAAKWFQVAANATETPKVRQESLYRRFVCLHKLGDQDGKLRALQEIVKDPKSPFLKKSRLALARLYQELKRPVEAHRQYLLLADSSDRKIRSEATLQAALTSQALKNPDLSKKWFAKALRDSGLRKQRSQTQLALMNLHYRDREWLKVIETFKVGNFDLDQETEVQRLAMAAKSYEALNKPEEVDRLYQRIAKLSPESIDQFDAGYRTLVKLHSSNSRRFLKEAPPYLEEWSAKHPKDRKLHSIRLLTAESFYQQKNYKRALQHYRLLDLTLIDPANRLVVRYHVAMTQLSLKDERGALAAINAFLDEFPQADQAPQLQLERAEILTSMNRESEATADYKAVLASTKDQKLRRIILLRLAKAAQKNKEFDRFASLQNQLLNLPDLDRRTKASANFWLGWNHNRLKETSKALPYLRKARELEPNTFTSKVGPLLIRAAYLAEDTDLLEKEINRLRKSSGKTDLPKPIVRWLGATLSKQGHHKRAWPLLREGLKNPEKPISNAIWKLYAETSLATNNSRTALETLDTILASEENAYRKAEAYHLKAQAHLALKDYDDARDSTNTALKLRPQGQLDTDLRLLAGDIETAAGKPADALRHYVVVESLYAKSPEIKATAREKIIGTLKAIGTPEALKQLDNYR